MTRKILTAQIKVEIYYSLVCHGLFLEEQKECHNGTRGTGDLLYIDQHILSWLVGFHGISTFVGYLMPNPFLC